jgi:hypothetical protein
MQRGEEVGAERFRGGWFGVRLDILLVSAGCGLLVLLQTGTWQRASEKAIDDIDRQIGSSRCYQSGLELFEFGVGHVIA